MAALDRRSDIRRDGDRRQQAIRPRALERLRCLYEISTLLTALESAEVAISNVFAAVRKVLPLRSAVLVTGASGNREACTWAREDAGPDAVAAAQRRAEIAFRYLTNGGNDASATAALHGAKEREADNYISLPLVVDHRPPFGVLQFEGGIRGEEDLDFVNVVANQTAVFLARMNVQEERKTLLAQAQAARAEADAANHAKDDFLATLSHELRTPLNAILGWASLLSSGGLDEAQTERATDTIHRNALTQKQLIDDILDVQSIISGQLHIELEPTDVAAVVRSAVNTLKPTSDAKRIEIESVVEPGVASISGDAHRLGQVVWNLLSNAVKFTPAGGRIEIRLRRDGDRHVVLSVLDSGPGIPANFLPHIFDRFRQADSSARRRHGGLGLGLAIVEHIVRLHGGTVAAANAAEGTGALFTVRLPREAPAVANAVTAPRAATESTEGEGTAPVLDGIRVLVVDDSADDRILLTQALERWDADVRVASSAAEGRAILRRDRPHVVVSDIGLPGEDGYAFLSQVRELPADEGGLTPAIALTAYATEKDRERVLGSGFQLHLAKPVEPAALATAIADLARRSMRQEPR